MQKSGIIIYQKIKKYIKREYGRNRYHNMPDEQMLKLKEYRKEYQKQYQKGYRKRKKEQGNSDKNAVLNP